MQKFKSEGEPTAVYNADEACLIVVFPSRVMAGVLIYGSKMGMKGSKKVSQYVHNQARICPKSSAHPFKIAVRNANKAQIAELGDENFIIKDDRYASQILMTQRAGYRAKGAITQATMAR